MAIFNRQPISKPGSLGGGMKVCFTGLAISCVTFLSTLSLCVSLVGCRSSDPSDEDPGTPEVSSTGDPKDLQITDAPEGWNWHARGMQAQPFKSDWPHLYQSGSEDQQTTILESLGGGVGVIDFDLDGLADLFFTGGGRLTNEVVSGQPGQLFQNRGDWNFTPVGEQAVVSEANHYSHGAFVTDYDEDGFPDILVTGYGGLTLFRNQGDGTFTSIPLSLIHI